MFKFLSLQPKKEIPVWQLCVHKFRLDLAAKNWEIVPKLKFPIDYARLIYEEQLPIATNNVRTMSSGCYMSQNMNFAFC